MATIRRKFLYNCRLRNHSNFWNIKNPTVCFTQKSYSKDLNELNW